MGLIISYVQGKINPPTSLDSEATSFFKGGFAIKWPPLKSDQMASFEKGGGLMPSMRSEDLSF